MYQAQNGYQQPHSQQGFSQSYSGPPPAKKPKSNPVITRYPPPPGYKGPAQPQLPYGQTGWQPPAQPYGHGQPGYQSYPQQTYGAFQSYQAPQWPGYQQQAYPPTGYAPPQGYYPPPNTGYSAPPPAWPNPASAPPNDHPQPWQPPNFQQNKRRHNSAPFPHARNVSRDPLDGNGDPLPPQHPPATDNDNLEEDFDAEPYFARHPDEIDPAFSLGLIEWHAALPTKMALPSTYAEAELEAIAPRKPRPSDEESISDYFTKEKRDESLLSVRQTAAWQEVNPDLIFRDIPKLCAQILSMYEMLERYKDRPDPSWAAPPPINAPTPTPDASRQPTPAAVEPSSESMDVDGNHASSDHLQSEDPLDVLGNFEQAILAHNMTNGHHSRQHSTVGGSHSRTASMSSQTGERITRPKAVAPVRDRAQENILAALGVTGSPKMVYQTPGPAFGAPAPEQRQGSEAPLSRQNSVTSNTGRYHPPPPPPPQRYGHTIARPSSATSQHTAAGSDFHPDDNDATPRPKYDRTDKRKRSYGEFEHGSAQDGQWDGDDSTPRPREKQQRVEGTYGRRW